MCLMNYPTKSKKLYDYSVSDSEKSMLVNADRYLIVSGHRNYFYDQKNYYLGEIKRISEMYDKCKFKKKSYKKNCKEIAGNLNSNIERLEGDILYFRDKVNLFFLKFNS